MFITKYVRNYKDNFSGQIHTIECDYLIISDGTFSNTRSLIEKKKIKPKYFNSSS